MLNIQLAGKYAKAVFEIAQEEGKLEEYGKELTEIDREFFAVEGVMGFLTNPQTPDKAKKELVKKALKGEISPILYNFLLLLIDKRRIGAFGAILEEYRALANKALSIVVADVTTTGELSPEKQKSLAEKLTAVTGKKVNLRLHTDKSLIGGIVVKIGDKRIDGSVRGRLSSLAGELAGKSRIMGNVSLSK